ncbi:complement C1q-like protein 2 [Sardina pilchardus]|uniref:complement C1q-like protein 2 n=1 Tax=Sardina pilchardus TaxID=27697 RepID=UPI002E13F8D6
MKTCGAALMLLLCCCLAEPEESQLNIADEGGHSETAASTQQTCLPDIHASLREMSTLVAEQRVELRHTKTQMEAMETRLRASESLVERLKSENKAQAVNLNLTVSQVEELRREREERRVSFSASLLASGRGNTGPFSVATPLVYRHIYTNVGNAYNPNTGVFTAPVRGVYSFVLFVLGQGHATRTGVSLHKNGEHVVIAWSNQPSGYDKTSNGASLLLEVGDVVYVKLWHNGWVYDDQNHHTTFSGHLLFPM